MDHHSHRKTQHNHHQVQCHHLQWRGQHNHPHHCQRCKDCHLYHTPQSIMYHSHRQHKHLPEDCEIALEWCSLNQGRVVVGTKDWNHDNQGAGDTYQTQVGYTITNKLSVVGMISGSKVELFRVHVHHVFFLIHHTNPGKLFTILIAHVKDFAGHVLNLIPHNVFVSFQQW